MIDHDLIYRDKVGQVEWREEQRAIHIEELIEEAKVKERYSHLLD